jgi:hypothetical protein
MKFGAFSVVVLTCVLLGCGGGSGGSGSNLPPVGPADVPWTEGVWVQPVPAWGSATRITYPDPLAAISLGDLAGFGSHQGGHPEGLDHVWIYKTTDDLVKSWAAGTVSRVDVYSDQSMITIDYGHGLLGKHMSVATVNVAVGQGVQSGDVLGVAIPGSLNNEFQLMDENRGDGIKTDVNGYAYVSPFDYLEAGQQAALVALYQAQVVAPCFTIPQSVNAGNPWEPCLTNPTLIHHQNRGTLIGEWILSNRDWNTPDPLYFDILTINQVANAYGQFAKFCATDYNTTDPGTKGIVDGDFTLNGTPGQVLFTYRGSASPSWYGLYRIDESGGRAVMTLEWSAQGYPASLSANAAIYYERAPVYAALDAQLLGALP